MTARQSHTEHPGTNLVNFRRTILLGIDVTWTTCDGPDRGLPARGRQARVLEAAELGTPPGPKPHPIALSIMLSRLV